MDLFRTTERLLLRPLILSDHENWQQAFSSLRPAQNRWDESNWKASALTKSAFRRLLASERRSRAKDRAYDLGVFRLDDGLLIGQVRFSEIARGPHQNAVLGYRIFNPFWRQGYASEACAAALDLAFSELHLHRIEAGIEPDNKASIRVARSIGLRREGRSPRRLLADKRWVDLLTYAATCEDFGKRYVIPLKSM